MQAIGSEHSLKIGSPNTSSMKVNSLKSISSSKSRQLGIVDEDKTDNAGKSKTQSCIDSNKGMETSCKLSKEDCCRICEPETRVPPSSLSPPTTVIMESSGFKREEVEKLLKENEEKLRKDFEEQMEREVNNLKDKFDMILHNEQVRASLMLCEAHRERKEKIRALETQLESKNLTGLMYVLCSERRKSKIEKMRLTQEYTSYILALQGILGEAQSLILRLSRGYKTATRLDLEWRDKMKSVVKEFRNFVCHYEGGPPAMHQYLFDMPQLMRVEASTEDDLLEDPCEGPEEGDRAEGEGEREGEEEEEVDEDQSWYKRLDGKNRPFVVYGDLADFKPPDRREVLKKLKAANADERRVPKKWKEYVFNEMFVKAACPNIDAIRDGYLEQLPAEKWACQMARSPELLTSVESSRHRMQSLASEKGNAMGSILKIISSVAGKKPNTKTMLLGARDSMEIASSTKLLKERMQSRDHHDPAKVLLDVKARRTSIFQDISEDDSSASSNTSITGAPEPKNNDQSNDSNTIIDGTRPLGSIVHDSLSLQKPLHTHHEDATINLEKVCPVEQCRRLKVDSLIRSLPPYMRASPFMRFEQTFDAYECCSPEQLEMLIRRIADKKRGQSATRTPPEEDVLADWVAETPGGMSTQTGEVEDLPPCTCNDPAADEAELQGMIYHLVDLFPAKHTLDHIERECLHSEHVAFDRFKVLGQASDGSVRKLSCENKDDVKFKVDRLEEIKKILLKYPDLMDMFQSSPKC